MRSWNLELTSVRRPRSANERLHWSVAADERKFWRTLTYAVVTAAKVPALERVRLTLHVTPPDARRRDPNNLVPYCLKPCEDGVVDAGVIPDDTPQYSEAYVKLHPPGGQWHYRLEIEEVTDA